jgi:hypothetical protein
LYNARGYPGKGEARTVAELRAALDEISPERTEQAIGCVPLATSPADTLIPGDFATPEFEPSADRLRKAVPFSMDIRPCSFAGTDLVQEVTREVVEYQQQERCPPERPW